MIFDISVRQIYIKVKMEDNVKLLVLLLRLGHPHGPTALVLSELYLLPSVLRTRLQVPLHEIYPAIG